MSLLYTSPAVGAQKPVKDKSSANMLHLHLHDTMFDVYFCKLQITDLTYPSVFHLENILLLFLLSDIIWADIILNIPQT